MTDFTPRKNAELAARALAHIAANLEEWDQAHINKCFAGHTLLLSGYTWEATHPGIYYFRNSYDGKIVENALVEAATELGFTTEDVYSVFLFYPYGENGTKETDFAQLTKRVYEVLANDNDTDF